MSIEGFIDWQGSTHSAWGLHGGVGLAQDREDAAYSRKHSRCLPLGLRSKVKKY